MRQAQRHLAEGLHPRVICEARVPRGAPLRRCRPAVRPRPNRRRRSRVSSPAAHSPCAASFGTAWTHHSCCATQGFDIAKKAALEFAAELKIPVAMTDGAPDRDVVASVARTALRTKLHAVMADQARHASAQQPGCRATQRRQRRCRRAHHLHAWALTRLLRAPRAQLTDIVVDALATIRRPDVPIDLHMVEARSFLNARAALVQFCALTLQAAARRHRRSCT
jgi:hypothetical protein